MYNKLSELKQCISLYKAEIICLTETHFNKDILEAEVDIPGYVVFRQDRDFSVKGDIDKVSHGGGSIIYIDKKFKPNLIEWFKAPDSIAVEIDTNVGKVNVACVYRSNSLNTNQNNMLIKMIDRLVNYNVETMIIGDYRVH